MRSPCSRRRTHVLAAAVIGITASLLAPLAPAAGGTTTLCVGYRGCAQEGKGSGGYAKANDRMYWQMYAGHNCTNYVAFRMVRRGMANQRPWSGSGNATHWGTELRHRTDQRPGVGSVAWWKAGTGRGGRTGHIAHVEKVVSPSEIVVSQDSWGGDFSWARITKGDGWPTGFIHLRDTPLRSTQPPAVSGPLRVGERVTASRGAWRVRPTSVRYRWLVGGQAVNGADTRTLQVSRRMLGKRLQVRAAATRLGYPRSVVTSRATRRVQPGLISVARRPALTGRAQVGHALRVSPGSWSPRPQRLSYRWQADGKPIRGATSRTLSLGAGRAGARIAVEVTARRPGYEPVARTLRARERVAAGSLRLSTRPRLSGTPRRGEELRVRAGSTSPHAPVRRVRWLRDGRPIKGATSRTYRLGVADLGHQVRAAVSHKRDGYARLTALSPPTRPVRTTPRVTVTADRRGDTIRLTVTGRGAGRPLTTGVAVTRSGRVLDRDMMRRGRAVLRLTGLRPGRRAVRVVVGTTPTTERYLVTRTLRIRR
jgi:surface antigen